MQRHLKMRCISNAQMLYYAKDASLHARAAKNNEKLQLLRPSNMNYLYFVFMIDMEA